MKPTCVLFSIILFLTSCRYQEEPESATIEADRNKLLLLKADTLDNDSVFSDFLDCLNDSLTVKIIRQNKGGIPPNKTATYPRNKKGFVGYSTDPKKIIQLIDSFPLLWEKPGVKFTLNCDCVTEEVLFLCDNDTLIECSFYPGMTQLYLNREVYTIDISKLERALDKIVIKP